MSTSALATDAYKFAMAQAGFPLRRETFYFSFRHGGPQFIPLDLERRVRDMIVGLQPTAAELEYARQHGYGFTGAMELALQSADLEIVAVPKGAWVLDREPIFSVTGPSFLVSWLEPMVLWFNFPIQLATALELSAPMPERAFVATCPEHAAIIESVLVSAGRKGRSASVVLETDRYAERVRRTVHDLVEAASGDPRRVFEVGMRSAVCMEQHRIALEACKAEGVSKTTNMHLARELGLSPVGAMGHEHVQRWGADQTAFEALRDMRSATPTYLLDTFDTMSSGITSVVKVMQQRSHDCAIRYDSGNKFIQYLHACEVLAEHGFEPSHVLEDGLDLAAMRHFESLRAFTRWPADKQVYGFGGTIVSSPMMIPWTRDRVGAVFKLAQTGDEPRMKFGNERGLGKQSVPGQPVVFRRVRGDGPLGIIAQRGEKIPDDYVELSGNPDALDVLRLCNVLDLDRAMMVDEARRAAVYSPATSALIASVSGAFKAN